MRTEPIVQAERDAFLRTQIDAVYGLNLPLIVMDALGCVLIASFCWSAATAPVLGLWLSINAVAMVVRAAVAFAYRLGRLPAIGTRGWAAALIAGAAFEDRKSVVQGKSVSVRVDLGGRRIITNKKHTTSTI